MSKQTVRCGADVLANGYVQDDRIVDAGKIYELNGNIYDGGSRGFALEQEIGKLACITAIVAENGVIKVEVMTESCNCVLDGASIPYDWGYAVLVQ